MLHLIHVKAWIGKAFRPMNVKIKLVIGKKNTTFYDKITEIKLILIPKLTFLIQSLPIPKDVINELKSIFYKF